MADTLRTIRERRELTRAQVQKATGVYAPNLCNIELGRVEPTVPTLEKLATVYRVSMAEIVAASQQTREERAHERPKPGTAAG